MTRFPDLNQNTIRSCIARTTLAGLFAFGAVGIAQAADDKPEGLPSTLAWSAYDVGSGGYNQAVAIGNALKQKWGVNLRVLPGKNDVSRNLPLKAGQVQFSANGIGGSYLAQEGVFEFGARSWGPQPVRGMLINQSDQATTIVAAKDSGVRTMADLKGKRVAWVIGSPALNQNITALLAFANLSWSDVQRVDFGGYGAALDGLINGQVDAAFSTSISGKAYQIAKSPRGLVYPVIAHADKEGWKRINETAPFFAPFSASEGADLDKDHKAESAAYPYPILMTYEVQDDKLVYAMTKAMLDLYPVYKDAAPGNVGWALDRQNFAWVIPYHEGAVRYFKEKGVWQPEHQAHNNKLVERQKVLQNAWKTVQAQNIADDKAFEQAWQKARAEALKQRGFDVVVTDW